MLICMIINNFISHTFIHIISLLMIFINLFRYMFDEISTYLDIKQRLKVARFIRDLQTELKYLTDLILFLSLLMYYCI